VGLLSTRTLSVAEVRLSIHSELVLVDVDDPFYVPFLNLPDPAGRYASSIDLEVVAGREPPNDAPESFYTGSEWMAQPEGDGYRLSLYGDGTGRFSMVARSDADTTHVLVHAPHEAGAAATASGQVANPVHYPLDQLLLMNHLALRDGVILHAAGAVVHGRALVFPGVSGAGKSTLARLFMAAGLIDSLLSDDRVILRGRGPVEVWGTPWPGDAGVARNAGAPLEALFFLVKAESTELVPVGAGTAMRRLMPAVSCPWYDRDRGNHVLDTCARVVESFPCYDLRFRPDAEVVALLAGWSGAGEGECA
jgi:hypothetical protein